MKNNSLLYQFVLLFLFMILIPIFCVIFYSYKKMEVDAKMNIIKEDSNILEHVSKTANLIFNDIESMVMQQNFNDKIMIDLKNISGKEHLTYQDYEKIKEINSDLRLVISTREYVNNINIIFANNSNSVFSSKYGLLYANQINKTDWYNEYLHQMENGFFIKNLSETNSYGEVLNESVVVCYYLPLVATRKNAAVIFFLNKRYLEDMIQNYGINNGKLFFFTQDNEILIGDKSMANDIKEYYSESPAENVSGLNTKLGSGYYIIHRKLDYFNLSYAIYSSYEQVNNLIHEVQPVYLLLIAVSVLSSIVLANLLARKFYTPIQSMVSLIENKGKDQRNHFKKKNNEYSYIAYNILDSYIKEKNLENELFTQELNLKEAKMAALQAQMNPHFLYNTLNFLSLRAFDALGLNNDISRVSEDLSDLLRYSISDPDEMTTLFDELRNVGYYTNILSMRYNNRFVIHSEINKVLLPCKTPKLIIQPIVENAYYHGIRESKTGFLIHISCKREGESLFIDVFDNGIGITESTLTKLRQSLSNNKKISYDHIGLTNVNMRIKLKYGDSWGIEINSVQNEWTIVRIKLPIVF